MSKFKRTRVARGLPKIKPQQEIVLSEEYFNITATICAKLLEQLEESNGRELKANMADAILNSGHLPDDIVKRVNDCSNAGQMLQDSTWIVATIHLDTNFIHGVQDVMILAGCKDFKSAAFLAKSQEITLIANTDNGKILRVK